MDIGKMAFVFDEQAIRELYEALVNFANAIKESFGICLLSFENRPKNVTIVKRLRPRYGMVHKNYNYIPVAIRNQPYQRRMYC